MGMRQVRHGAQKIRKWFFVIDLSTHQTYDVTSISYQTIILYVERNRNLTIVLLNSILK